MRMKKIITILFLFSALSVSLQAQDNAKDGSLQKYRRSSLATMMVYHPEDEFGKDIREALQILFCTGLLSLLSWLSLVGFVMVPWARRKGRSRASAAIGSGLTCFLCNMLFCITSIIIMPFFWCFLGLLNSENIETETRPQN